VCPSQHLLKLSPPVFATSQSTTPVLPTVSDNHIPYHVCLSLDYIPPFLSSCSAQESTIALVLFIQGNRNCESRHDDCDEKYACIWHFNSIVGFSRMLIRHDVNKTRITTCLKGADGQAFRRLEKCYETVHKSCLYCTDQTYCF